MIVDVQVDETCAPQVRHVVRASGPGIAHAGIPGCRHRGQFRIVSSNDKIVDQTNRKVFVSHLLGRKEIGLEDVGDKVWSVCFGPVHLGWLDETDYRITDVRGRKSRKR